MFRPMLQGRCIISNFNKRALGYMVIFISFYYYYLLFLEKGIWSFSAFTRVMCLFSILKGVDRWEWISAIRDAFQLKKYKLQTI